MIAKGKLNKQIAFELGITQRTVEVHRARVMEKMQARTVADLLRTVMSLDTFAGKP
jgi:FixJ family two-component response regulator